MIFGMDARAPVSHVPGRLIIMFVFTFLKHITWLVAGNMELLSVIARRSEVRCTTISRTAMPLSREHIQISAELFGRSKRITKPALGGLTNPLPDHHFTKYIQ